MQIEDWNGKPIEAVLSRSGVVCLVDFADNHVKNLDRPWPPAYVAQKLHRAIRKERGFSPVERTLLTRKLGYYSNLQSIHSEDALNASYFGTLSSESVEVQTRFSNWILERLGLAQRNSVCQIDLWRRIPHPENLGADGPEMDVILQGDQAVIIGELKWNSPESANQGRSKNRSQLALRRAHLHVRTQAFYGNVQPVLLAIVENPACLAAPLQSDEHVSAHVLQWADLIECPVHPRFEELQRYYRWKREHTRFRTFTGSTQSSLQES